MDLLALDIGGTKHSFALFRDHHLARHATFPTDAASGRAGMLAHLRAALPAWLGADRPAACGIGFGGTVDYRAQQVGVQMHSDGWEACPLPALVGEMLGLPCVMDNDANLGALGEYTAGAARGAASLLYVTLSTGIGAGLLLDGKMVHGADSLAGELGHVPLEAEGPPCSCGSRGCFEALCSGRDIETRAGRPAAELLQDPEFRSEYIRNLARGIKTGLLVLNPERVVVGGGIARTGETLFRELRAELRRTIPASLPVHIDVRPAALGDDSVLWGAAALAAGTLGTP